MNPEELKLKYSYYRFFTEYLVGERGASSHTIRSYSDTFTLVLTYMDKVLGKAADRLALNHFTRETVLGFLDWVQKDRKCSNSTRNQRLAALHSFFGYMQYEDVKRLLDFAISKFRDIDIWINNAGMAPTSIKEFHELDPEKIQATVNTNILGTLYGSQVAISQMKDKGGMIYNLEGFGSTGMVRKGMQVYGTTKNSIAYIRKALSHEYKDSNVKICSIQPGMAVTNLILPREPGEKFDKSAYWVFNVISDTTENIAAKIVPLIKANTKGNKVLKYSSMAKTIWNFFTSWRFKDRFFDAEGTLKIQKIEDKILQE